jgi:hypothetical protein
MPPDILQRYAWPGQADKMGDGIRLRKIVGDRERAAVGELWSHQLGWELRLFVDGEWQRSKVCRDQEAVFSTIDEWRAALLEKGWA